MPTILQRQETPLHGARRSDAGKRYDGSFAMSLGTHIRYSGGITIFDLAGRLTSGLAGDSLRDKLFDAFEHGHRLLLLNCEGLTFIDSGGLGELVSAHAAIVRRGGAIKLLSPSKRLAELLQLTRLDALFE